jgi:hypothetical protein
LFTLSEKPDLTEPDPIDQSMEAGPLQRLPPSGHSTAGRRTLPPEEPHEILKASN